MKKPIDEADILKPVSPSILDDNDWPIFVLTNADITDPTTGQPKSLLFANELTPLTVTGRLERLDKQTRQCLIERDSLPALLTVEHVDRFSYGQFDNGEVAFWAAGKAGWFEVNPSRQYKAIYNTMSSAIKILYFTADFYRDKKGKKLRQASIDTVLAQYADDSTFESPDEEAAGKTFLKHRDILLQLMNQGKEGVNWPCTAVYKYLEQDASRTSTPNPDTPADTSDEGNIRAVLAGKGKSSLRPKTSQQSGKGTARQRALQGLPEEEEDEDMAASPVPAAAKRRAARLDMSGRPRKRSRTLNETDEDETTVHSAYSTGDEILSPQRIVEDALLPLDTQNIQKGQKPGRPPKRRGPHNPNTKPRTGLSVTVKTENLPLSNAIHAGDVWTCRFDGCSHKVYAASDESSKKLITEHFRAHAHDSQSQIDLVQQEERPYLPVSNLIMKIREMTAQANGTVEPTSRPINPWAKVGVGWPKSIDQKL